MSYLIDFRKTVIAGFLISLCYICACNETPEENNEDISSLGLQEQLKISTLPDNYSNLVDTPSINRQIGYADSLKPFNQEKAREVLITALRNSLQLEYNEGIAGALSRIGELYFKRRSFDTALIYFQKALYYANKPPEQLRLKARINNAIGAAYDRLAKQDSAAYYLYQAAQLLERKDMQSHLNDKDDQMYLNLATFWRGLYENDKVISFLNKAKVIAYLRGDAKQMLEINYQLATMYFNQYKDDSAMVIFQKIKANPLCDTIMLLKVNKGIGDVHSGAKQPDKALPFYKTAYTLSLISEDSANIITARLKLAEAYYLAGNTKVAQSLFISILDPARRSGNNQVLEFAYQYLAAIYDKQDNYKAANQFRAYLIALREASYPKEISTIKNRLDVQYRVAEKDKLLAQKQLQLTLQQSQLREKNFWIGSIAASSLLLLVFGASVYRSYKRKKNLHEKQLQLLQQEQQINQLWAVMKGEEQERIRLARELHDGVGGMLAAIKMNVSRTLRKDDSESKTASLHEVLHLVEDTADEVRKTAHNLMPDIITKHSLPQALRMYCDNVNTGKDLEIDLQFHLEWQRLVPSFELSLYRMIQEIIQNIIKHAHATHAVIQFRQEDNTLFITAEDDGQGFNTSQVATGLGLQNLTSRTAALGGHISIESTPGRGTTCFIELPLEKHIKTSVDGNNG